MKKRFVLALTVPLLVSIPWAAFSGEKASVPSDREDRAESATADGACRTIAAILCVYPALEVRKAAVPVLDVPNGSGSPAGCGVLASGPASAVA